MPPSYEIHSGTTRRRQGRTKLALVLGALLATLGPEAIRLKDAASTPAPLSHASPIPDVEPFGMIRLHQVHVTISADEWNALGETYVARGRGGGGNGFVDEGETDFVREDGRLIHIGSGFGGYFPWVHADLEFNGQRFSDVGLRYKGNSSYTASQDQLRRNLKLKFDLFRDAPRLFGQKTLNLQAGAVDSTRIRESLSYAVFRAAGVPAPRTSYAEVTLTVPGLYSDEYVGLYTLVENVGKPFLKAVLPPGTGLLMKPESATGGITYLGAEWGSYARIYRPDREATPAEQERVMEFASLVNRADEHEFSSRIEEYLDVDAFLRFVAVNALLANMDSFLGGRHNFYLYLDSRDNRFRFIPWDMDLSLGSFGGGRGGGGGGMGDILNLSLAAPNRGWNPLITRILGESGYRKRYDAILREIVADTFNRSSLLGMIDRIEATIEEPLAHDGTASWSRGELGTGRSRFGRGPVPREFVEQRTRNVGLQLAGRTDGWAPGSSRGPGFGGRF